MTLPKAAVDITAYTPFINSSVDVILPLTYLGLILVTLQCNLLSATLILPIFKLEG
jgi:hypothetical protein